MSHEEKPTETEKPPESNISDGERKSAKPVAEREPGETAKTGNEVRAKDAFGAPKPDQEWTREAIVTKRAKPSFGSTEDRVTKEQAKDLKE